MILSTALLAAALALLLAAVLAAAVRGLGLLATGTERWTRLRAVADGLLTAGATVLLGGLVARAVATGHAPWSNFHEFSAAFAFGVLAAQLGIGRRYGAEALTPAVGLLAAGLIGVALAQPDDVQPLVPALQMPVLLSVHVGAAVAAYAIGGLAFAASVAELLQRGAADRIGLLPSALVSRRVAHRAAVLAFPVLTVAIALGSVWANLAWRSYWSNDPKELAAAATWLVYGGYLHVAGRRDRWAAAGPWLLVLGFGGVLFTWLAAGFLFVGEHSYAGS